MSGKSWPVCLVAVGLSNWERLSVCLVGVGLFGKSWPVSLGGVGLFAGSLLV